MGHMMGTTNPEAAAKMQEEGDAAIERAAEAMQSGESLDPAPEVAAVEPDAPQGPLPEVGDMVIYRPRQGEIRRGRDKLAAIVTWVYVEERRCDLCVIFTANDVVEQERVPERVGEERGWEIKAARGVASPVVVGDVPMTGAPAHVVDAGVTKLRADVAELRKLVLGEYEAPHTPILAMLDDMDGRIDKLVGDGRPTKPKAKAKTKAAPKGKKRK